MIASPRVLKAARVMLGWSQEELADRSGIGRTSLSKLEAGSTQVRLHTIRAVQAALQEGGIKFLPEGETEGEGVRFKATGSQAG